MQRLLLQHPRLPRRLVLRASLSYADDRVVDFHANGVFLLPQPDLGLAAFEQRRRHIRLRTPILERNRHLHADRIIGEITPKQLPHARSQTAQEKRRHGVADSGEALKTFV